MKVLHVIPSLSPLKGGPSAAIGDMTRALARAGVEVEIATTDDNGRGHLQVPLGQPVFQDGVTVRYFRRQTNFYAFSWPLISWLARHVQDYDLLHIHALFSCSSVAAAFWAQRRGVPYIVRPLGVLNRWGMANRRRWLKQVSFRLVEQRVLNGAALIHYTSEQERDEAVCAGARGPSQVLPLGIDVSPFEHLPSPQPLMDRHPGLKKRPVVLYLSRLDAKKGLDLLLPAWQESRQTRPGAVLAIAGGGETAFVAGLRNEARQLGIEDDVVWLGHLGGEAKLAAFALADLFVLPSYSENFGVSVVEAMAAGLPVVVSDRVGLAPDIDRAGAGLVVPCEIEALSGAISLLLSDSKMRQSLGNCGQQYVSQHLSSDAVTHRLIDQYDFLLPLNRRSTQFARSGRV